MTRQQVLSQIVRQSRVFSARFYKGFDDTNHTCQATHLPNHFAWSLGHVSLVMSGCARHFDGKELPIEDFGTDPTGAPPTRYDPAVLGFGSIPVPDPMRYPSCARCVVIFDRTIDRLATAVADADDATLDKLVPWGGSQHPLWTIVSRNAIHVSLHAGQIADLRRGLNMPPVLG